MKKENQKYVPYVMTSSTGEVLVLPHTQHLRVTPAKTKLYGKLHCGFKVLVSRLDPPHTRQSQWLTWGARHRCGQWHH